MNDMKFVDGIWSKSDFDKRCLAGDDLEADIIKAGYESIFKIGSEYICELEVFQLKKPDAENPLFVALVAPAGNNAYFVEMETLADVLKLQSMIYPIIRDAFVIHLLSETLDSSAVTYAGKNFGHYGLGDFLAAAVISLGKDELQSADARRPQFK